MRLFLRKSILFWEFDEVLAHIFWHSVRDCFNPKGGIRLSGTTTGHRCVKIMAQTWDSKEWSSKDGLSPRWGSPNLAANGRKLRAGSTMSYQDWIFSGFIYLATILCVIIWVSTTAIQDVIVLVFSTCVRQQGRSLHNMGHSASFRRICNEFSSNQSPRQYCSTQNSLLWAPHFNHMVTRSGLRKMVPISAICEGLYCAKGNRFFHHPRNRHRHHRHRHCHQHLIEPHIKNQDHQIVHQSLSDQSQQHYQIQISQLNRFIQEKMSEGSASSRSPPATPRVGNEPREPSFTFSCSPLGSKKRGLLARFPSRAEQRYHPARPVGLEVARSARSARLVR
jgi:hypothetical protein